MDNQFSIDTWGKWQLAWKMCEVMSRIPEFEMVKDLRDSLSIKNDRNFSSILSFIEEQGVVEFTQKGDTKKVVLRNLRKFKDILEDTPYVEIVMAFKKWQGDTWVIPKIKAKH